MIRSIYFERYRKFLIAIFLLILVISGFSAIAQNNQWKNLYNNPDPNAQIRFESNRDEYRYFDQRKQKSVPYKSYEDHRKAQLLFYGSFSSYSQSVSEKSLAKAQNYSSKAVYSAKFGHYYLGLLLLLIVPLAGFLLFFIDQKTGFNQFLFSLGIPRKELFNKKLLYIAVPFLLSVFIGQSLYALLIHSLIPAPYMNATLGQLFTSVISNFCLLLLMFSTSAFIGSMVGNIVFGPLTWAVYWLLMIAFPTSVYRLGNILYTARRFSHPRPSETLFVHSVGKMGGHWWMNILFLFLSLLFIFWASKKYQTLSLENDNSYLLHRESRWPVWGMMTLFTSFVLALNVFDPWSLFLSNQIHEQPNVSIRYPIMSNIVVLLIVGCVCALIVFFREVTKNTLDKINHRTG